jgi:hypothetical protein
MSNNKTSQPAFPVKLLSISCLAALLASSGTAIAQAVVDKPATQATPAAEAAAATKPAAATPGCAINSFGRTGNGKSFWATTGQSKVTSFTQINCLLDQFAMNNFLYLVGNDANGKPRFMSYAPWYTLFVATGAPTWPGKYMPLSTVELNKFENQAQAGDQFALMDVNSAITSYDVRVNKKFFDYVKQNSYYTKAGYTKATTAFNANSATGGIFFPPNVATDNTEGAIEIKTAWRKYGPMQKPTSTEKGKPNVLVNPCPLDVMHCEVDAKGDWWGLTGFHLVQKTVDQPGFVWATFEHVGNVPDCSQGGTTPISQNPVSPATGKPMNMNARLYNTGIGNQTGWNYFNYSTYKTAGGDGKSCSFPTSPTAQALCLTNPTAGTGWKAVNVCRTLPLPVPSPAACSGSLSDGANLTASSCLNYSVQQNFSSTGLNAKWMNYRLVGLEWLALAASAFGQFTPACLVYDETGPNYCPNYVAPKSGGGLGADAKAGAPTKVGDGKGAPQYARDGTEGADGKAIPANTTMETWLQYRMQLTSTVGQKDCLKCHQPGTGGGQGDFSHLFNRIKQ